jgi:hypothetical protein
MAGRLEEESLGNICDWLDEYGFSEQLVETFRGKNYTVL